MSETVSKKETLRTMLDAEFDEILNSNRAKRSIETAIRVVDVVLRYEEKTCPYAKNEINALKLVQDALEGMKDEVEF